MTKRMKEDADTDLGTMVIVVALILVGALVSVTLMHFMQNIAEQTEETGTSAYKNVRTAFSMSVTGIVGDRQSATEGFSTGTVTESVVAADVDSTYINITTNASRTAVVETWTVECGGSPVDQDAANFYLNGSVSGNIATGNSGNGEGLTGGYFGNTIISVQIRESTVLQENYTAGDFFRFTTSLNAQNTIEWLEIDIAVHSPKADMDDVFLQVSSGTVVRDLYFDSSTANATRYTIDSIRDPEGYWTAGNIVGSGSMFRLVINCSGLSLGSQDTLTVRIVPKHGPVQVIEQEMPENLQEDTRYVDIY